MSAITPTLATIGRELPTGDDWVFEPKYDGVRVLAFADYPVDRWRTLFAGVTAQMDELEGKAVAVE